MGESVNFVKSGISVLAGVGDEFMESWDEKSARTGSFKTATDLTRLAGAIAGYAIQVVWPKHGKIGEALALSYTPLLVKSIAKPLRSAVGGTSSVSTFVPRQREPRAMPSGMARVGGSFSADERARNVAPMFETNEARVW